MSTCTVCKRPLKREPWASMGIGKICSRKKDLEKQFRQEEESGDTHLPYDGGDIFIERLKAPTLQPSGQTVMQFHTASGITTNVPYIMKRHSSQFNFGYGGSGPADFAMNVCLLFAKNPEQVFPSVYQEFKWKYVAVDEKSRLVIPRQAIIDFLKQKGVAVKWNS